MGADDQVKNLYKTPNGKEIAIKPDGTYGMFIIQFTSGGQQPKEFEGLFTGIDEAEKVILSYIESKTPKDTEAEVKEKTPTDGPTKRKQAL